MSKRPNDMRRGNDLLNKPRGEADEFDLYHGPMGGDVRSSIRSQAQVNRDDIEGFQVQKVGRGSHGHKRPSNNQGDGEQL